MGPDRALVAYLSERKEMGGMIASMWGGCINTSSTNV